MVREILFGASSLSDKIFGWGLVLVICFGVFAGLVCILDAGSTTADPKPFGDGD